MTLKNALWSVAIYAVSVSTGQAFEGKCLLEVRGHIYLSGTCNIDNSHDTLSIGTGDRARSKYFAFVSVGSDGTAQGYWNGVASEDRAGEELGKLRRSGACWINDYARVCAWR